MNRAARLLPLALMSWLPPAVHAQTPPGSAAQCLSCHGARGEGNAALGAPRLASQWNDYLLRQLDAFADGSRNSAVMTPIAKGLDGAARKALAAYYAALIAPPSAATDSAGDVQRGQSLATMGDGTHRIQACANCHGPEGSGLPPQVPYLAGQQSVYLAASLKAWRDGSRKNDPTGQMPAIAAKLSDGDVQAVTRYFAGRMPPPPFVAETGGTKAKGAAAPGRAPTGPAPAGAGSEQGAGVTGGGQGPGGGGGTRTGP